MNKFNNNDIVKFTLPEFEPDKSYGIVIAHRYEQGGLQYLVQVSVDGEAEPRIFNEEDLTFINILNLQ